MESNLSNIVKRVNELYIRSETGNELNELELKEQRTLRNELIDYFKFAISKHISNKERLS